MNASSTDGGNDYSPPSKHHPSDILTLEQVAEYLQIHVNTARKIVQSGELQAARIRGCIRVTRRAIEQYVASKETPAPRSLVDWKKARRGGR